DYPECTVTAGTAQEPAHQSHTHGSSGTAITAVHRPCIGFSMTAPIDLTGRRFGRWQVLTLHPERVRYARSTVVLWFCGCDCGTERLVTGDSLRRGTSTNCGCIQREKLIKLLTTHGMTGTRAHQCWKDLLARCRNPQHAWYHRYGARGITVCD